MATSSMWILYNKKRQKLNKAYVKKKKVNNILF